MTGAEPRLAYVTGRYPGISHTFILREVTALRALGLTVDAYSVWTTDAAELLSRADRDEAASTYTAFPLRHGALLLAHLGALRRAPRAYGRLLATALGLGVPGVRGRLQALTWFAEAILFWNRMRRRGTTHVHAHLQGTAPAVALLIARFGRAAGGPTTWSFTAHGPTEFYNVAQEGLVRKVREATFVVAISDFARSQLMGFCAIEDAEKLEVVHCGVDPQTFTPRERAREEGRFRILVVARLAPVKGHSVLLRALRSIVDDGIDAQLTVIGDGPIRGALEALATELDLAGRVAFLGSVGQDDIRRHFEAADVFCLPSFAEGVPVVLMEAMAMGLPVIASRVMGVSELVDDGVTGVLARPARPDQVAAALRRLHDDPQLRSDMGAAARATVQAEFDSARSARMLAEHFRAYADRR